MRVARLRPAQVLGALHCQCFANISQCAGAQSWCRLAGASCWISRRLQRGLAAVVFVAPVAHARYGTHCVALRVYIGVLFCEVIASRCAKAPLGGAHRCAPWRVYKTHPM